MDYVIVGLLAFLVMFLVMKAFQNSINRVRSQMIGITVVLAIVVIAYCSDFSSITKTLLYLLSIVLAYGLAVFLVLRNTNFFRRAKFKHNMKEKKLLAEKMPSSKVLRRRYIISIIALFIGVSAIIVFTIFKFDIIMLITSILGVIFLIIYAYQVFRMNVFSKDEPIRKLIIINRSKGFKVYSNTGEGNVFDTSKYLDKLRQMYYVKPICKVFLYKDKYEIHNAYIIDSDSFESFDFLVEEPNMAFYKDLLKESMEGFAPYFGVSEIDGKIKYERLK